MPFIKKQIHEMDSILFSIVSANRRIKANMTAYSLPSSNGEDFLCKLKKISQVSYSSQQLSNEALFSYLLNYIRFYYIRCKDIRCLKENMSIWVNLI